MNIEPFQTYQAKAVSDLIRRGLLEINAKDYPLEFITSLVDYFSPAQIVENAQVQHIFVALEEGKVIGTSGLANFGSAEKPNYYGVAVFVEPERQGQGIGKQLVAALEAKAKEIGANKITVRAAIRAERFYEKLGFQYRDGKDILDEKGYYILEKVLKSQGE
jgi:GNAT superfamily N-acetyltransferase